MGTIGNLILSALFVVAATVAVWAMFLTVSDLTNWDGD